MEQITREEMIELLSRVEAAMEFPYQDPMILQNVRKAKAALQAAEPLAWLAGEVCGGDASHNTVNVALDNPAPWSALPMGARVAIRPLLPAKAQIPIGEVIEEMSSDPEFVRGLEEGRQRISEAKAQVPNMATLDDAPAYIWDEAERAAYTVGYNDCRGDMPTASPAPEHSGDGNEMVAVPVDLLARLADADWGDDVPDDCRPRLSGAPANFTVGDIRAVNEIVAEHKARQQEEAER